ncbi:HCP-like protein, partial [Rhizophagus irregularis]
FGLSKKVTEASSITSKIQGVIPYVDPKKLNDKNYKLNKKSDVYSVGILLWQISSGHEPFEGIEQDVSFILSLIKGKREKIIDGTPVKYSKLYTECWKYESNERPSMHEVILALKEIISSEIIVDSLNELNEDNKSTYSSEKYGPISKTNKVTVDINDDLNINNSLILSTISHIASLENSNICESKLSSQNYMDVVEFKNTSSSSNKSDTLDQISVDMNETISVAMADGLGKGTEKDEIKAFQYYETLANKKIVDAQLKLGDCFYNGIGTKLDITQAKYWYENAAINGNIVAKNNLKNYYNERVKFEIDIHKKIRLYKMLFSKRLSQLRLYCTGKLLLKTNYEKSFYYLQKAAANGCKFAQFNLGGCYQLGHGVRKDIRKAFELYKKSAKQEYINAQSQLIYYYGYGLGTEINRVKAFELVKIMAEKGFKHAQYLLGLHYITGEGVDKDEIKAFKLFEKLAKE